MIEGSRDIVEDNYKVEDSTHKSNKVEGQTAKEEAITATLEESDRY